MYHINNDGKIYPCRAKVKMCPYGSEWHAETEEELYDKVLNDFSTAETTQQVDDILNSGGGVYDQPFMEAIESTENGQLETLLASYREAIRRERLHGQAVPGWYHNSREKVIQAAAEAIEAARFNVSSKLGLPRDIRIEATERAREIHSQRGFFEKSRYMNDHRAYELERRVQGMAGEIQDLKDYEASRPRTPNFSEEDHQIYLNNLMADYKGLSKIYNREKVASTVIWGNAKSVDRVIENIDTMDDYELLSLYDDASVDRNYAFVSDDEAIADKQLIYRLLSTHDGVVRAPKAVESINKKIDRYYRVAQTNDTTAVRRLYVSVIVAKELMRRKIRFGDMRRMI